MSRVIDYYNKYKDKYTVFTSLMENIKFVEYTDGERYNILPYYFERGFMVRGKKTEEENAVYTYGFDDTDRMIYVRYGNNQEFFLVYFKESIILFCFKKVHGGKKNPLLKYIQITELADNGLPYGTIEVDNQEKILLEKYHYEDGKLSKIENPLHFRYGTSNDTLDIEYDYYGELYTIIDHESWLPKGLVYRKCNRREAEALREKIISAITENIISEVIKQHEQRKDDVCYISMEIHEEPHTILSSMYSRVAFEDERKKYIISKVTKDEKEIWKYSNNTINFYDEHLKMECNILVSYYLKYEDYKEQCREIVQCILTMLRKFDWQNYIAKANNFQILEPLYYD